jgi:hypothetical protein
VPLGGLGGGVLGISPRGGAGVARGCWFSAAPSDAGDAQALVVVTVSNANNQRGGLVIATPE